MLVLFHRNSAYLQRWKTVDHVSTVPWEQCLFAEMENSRYVSTAPQEQCLFAEMENSRSCQYCSIGIVPICRDGRQQIMLVLFHRNSAYLQRWKTALTRLLVIVPFHMNSAYLQRSKTALVRLLVILPFHINSANLQRSKTADQVSTIPYQQGAGQLSGQSIGLVIERSQVQIPAGAVG